LLPDGHRLHLDDGPIDAVIEAWGEPSEVRAAHDQATAAFRDVLPALVKELTVLRWPLGATAADPAGAGGAPDAGGLLAVPQQLHYADGGVGRCRRRSPADGHAGRAHAEPGLCERRWRYRLPSGGERAAHLWRRR